MMEQQCTIRRVLPLETIGKKGFQKGRFHATWTVGSGERAWPVFAEFTCKGRDAAALMRGLSAGMEVNVQFHLDGREWDKGDGSPVRVFTDLCVDGILPVVAAPGQPADLPPGSAVKPYDPGAQYRPGDLCYRDGVTYQLSPDGRQWNRWGGAAQDSAPAPGGPASPASGDDLSDLPF